MNLTPNSIKKIFEGAKSSSFLPILQIIDLFKLTSYIRLIISDGQSYTQALLPESELKPEDFPSIKLSVIKLLSYEILTSSESRFLMINEFETLYKLSNVVGQPKKVEFKVETPETKNILYKFEEGEKINECKPFEKLQPDNDELYAPIRALSTTSSDWTIKARVTQKTNLKQWKNIRGEGTVFNCALLDVNGDEIQASFFNKAAEKYFNYIQIGKIYTFSGGIIKVANKKFSLVDYDIEINFDVSSLIQESADNGKISRIKFNFVPLDHLPKLQLHQSVDICGIVLDIDQPLRITSKKGEELIKRNMLITDHTDYSIEVTLWGENATLPDLDNISIESKPIITFKNLKVKDFNKLSLSSDRDSTIVQINNLNHPNAKFLSDWKNKRTTIFPSTPLTEKRFREAQLKTINEVKNEWHNVLVTEKTHAFKIYAILGKISLDDERMIWYESCKINCKKKVNKDSQGKYFCENCNQYSDNCEYRYLCNLQLNDNTGTAYATAFDDIMVELIGCSAGHFYELYINDRDKADYALAAVFGKQVIATIKVEPSENNKAGYKFIVKKLERNDGEFYKIMMEEIMKVN